MPLDLAEHAFSLADLVAWLAAHQGAAYTILFFGMYFETLVGTSLFVPGELFLLSGAILAGTGTLALPYVALALYAGAILGDTSNFFIGRRLGPEFFREGRRIFNPKNYEAGKRFFEKHGLKAIFLARLIGPFNLITPFLAGVYGVPYRSFLTYNLPGVLVGVGEFIIAGYFFGSHYSLLVSVLQRSILFAIIGAGIAYFLWHRFAREPATDEDESKARAR